MNCLLGTGFQSGLREPIDARSASEQELTQAETQ